MTPPAIRHPLFARLWSLMVRHEPPEIRQHRDELLAGLCGRVLEIGAGTGSNFVHYPVTVHELVAVEPEPYLRERARAAAAHASVAVHLVDGVAERLPFQDRSFDAGVSLRLIATRRRCRLLR